ncbi:MAG TPA: hypothetical protein VII37_06925 [Candidatus Acidoferrum sp.]
MPNTDKLVVEREKIADYLLNPAHPDNGGKAEFFVKLGFRREEWEVLAAALRALAQTAEITSHAESPHGGKYVIIGQIESPAARPVAVKTIWIVDKGLDGARLVTAYPHKE